MDMTIDKTANEGSLVLALEGRLDTTTAPELENVIKSDLDGVSELVIDMENLAYISSAGLRVLLSAQKIMNKQGSMVIKKVKPEIAEIFEITGFSDILTIE